MRPDPLWAAGCAALLCASLPAATTLFDFERDADVAALHWASKGSSALERSPRFATAGESSLLFTTPAWKQGLPEWPAFETRPPVTNWTGFDRLVVDVINPNEERYYLGLFVSDSKVPFRKGLNYKFDLPSRGFRRFVVPLAFPKEVNRADIAILHFFTERPKTDLALYLDNIVLLRADESLPDPGAKFMREAGALTEQALNAAQQSLARSRDSAQDAGRNATAQFAKLEDRIKSLRADFASPGLTLARLDRINTELAALPAQTEQTLAVIRFQKACKEAGQPADNMLVGVATSMEKILPRGASIDPKPARDFEVSLARNEKESFQVLVLPVADALRKVTVRASDLQSAAGAVFKSANIQCDVMGYVETKSKPPYGTSHIGWWPDPILDFLGPVDIAPGDLQSFWIRLRAPKDQPPGLYQGTLTVSAEGLEPRKFSLKARVRSFTLPDHSPLPLAITFSPEENAISETQKDQAEWRKSADYPVNAWRKHKLRWADMLADYYISYDSLYHQRQPDFEVLTHLHQQGRLGPFNLGYYGHLGTKPEDLEKWKNSHLPRLREAYAKAKELGLLDHAYIYGCDEAPKDLFPQVQQAAAILKAEFPDVLIATTTYDQSYGQQSVIKAMDWFCPLTPSFDPAKAAQARAAGKQVWWYICCGPHHPHANMFIEYPAIEGRLLMGAMTAKQRPDGFLYYQISIWNSRQPIRSGPFTDWNPRSWTTYHGDGSWTCAGPEGAPLPTIRLENFRDGLEDYAYVLILEDIIRQREAKGAGPTAAEKQWLADAKAALPVPEKLVKSMTDYSRDPAALSAWRDQLGDLIDRSGAPDANPWGRNFGVRGFQRSVGAPQ
jgi:hypothetical protein